MSAIADEGASLHPVRAFDTFEASVTFIVFSLRYACDIAVLGCDAFLSVTWL